MSRRQDKLPQTRRERAPRHHRASVSPHHGVKKKKKKKDDRRATCVIRMCICVRACNCVGSTRKPFYAVGAVAPRHQPVLGMRTVPDAPKYFVVIVRGSSSTNAAGLKLFDRTLATDVWPAYANSAADA